MARARTAARTAPAIGTTPLIHDRYRVVRQLGTGGMASVFEVQDGERPLALKRLSRHAAPRVIALFEREYYTLTSLHHPNIVEVYEYAADADGPYYTMELLAGADLSKSAPLPWPEACRILRDVASALALIHARRYVHRDISARNVWLTGEGQVKLIDFGTLVPFGNSGDVAGTPPFIAPEALHGNKLDQRTDLYSVGALGYWLLTGLQAFPARSINALDELWKQRPRAPSHRVAELKRKDLPELPPALDQLLDALLSHDPRSRPNGAAELIDGLCSIAGLQSETQPRVVESYLKTPVLAGRDTQLQLLRTALQRVQAGRGACVMIESAPGMGRSRMLSELALHARIASGIVLQVEPSGQQENHAVAEVYARKLLDALPAAARRAAQPYAPLLGHLSSSMRERLGLTERDLAELPKAHGEARMRIQAALCDWFMDVARDHTLILLADDVHEFDPGTVAWLAGLSRQGESHPILIVVTQPAEQGGLSVLDGMRRHATLMTLGPLSADATAAMLRSVFGDVAHLQRLSDLVFLRAEGNPGDTLDLIAHLVQQQLVHYVEGDWVLPTAIAEAQLPDHSAVLAARVQRLPPNALRLGQALSVREGLIPFEACAALGELPVAETLPALEALVSEGVLVGSAEGYRFTREGLRTALRAQLEPEREARVHRISGSLILQLESASPLQRLEGGLHLLLGGDVERGTEVVAKTGQHYGLVDLADVGQAAPALERALEVFERLDRPRHELLSLYGPLALAGYYAERRYADRYAEPTLELLQELLGLHRSRVLRRFAGKKLGLLLALGWSAFRFWLHRHNPRVPTFRRALLLLFNCAAALTGVCTVCIDAPRARRYADVLEPMSALGANHVASLMHEFCLNLAATVQDRTGLAHARWQAMIDRLDSAQPVRDLTEEVRNLYLAGALYACGVIESWRDASKALTFAQRLEDFKLKLYDLSANQIRMMYYAHQGNVELAQQHRERVEVHAIQRGTAWQAETWAFAALVSVYSRTYNAVGVKHCVQQLKQLSQEVPSLERVVLSSHGSYLVLRGSPVEALAYLDAIEEEPLANAGWARMRGTLASALNSLGQYARAKQVCSDTLALLTSADLQFPAMNLIVPIELALAEAGLGEHLAAAERLDALLKQHGPFEGPLTLSALHEARMQVAAIMQDWKGVEHHLACMERWQRATGDRSLIARGQRSAKHARAAAGTPEQLDPENRELDASQPLTVVHRLKHGGERTLEGSAEWIIDQLVEYADIRASHVFLLDGEHLACIASRGDIPDPGVFEGWVGSRLDAEAEDEATIRAGVGVKVQDPDRMYYCARWYRLLRLVTSSAAGSQLAGALVLSEETLFELPKSVLKAIADRLQANSA